MTEPKPMRKSYIKATDEFLVANRVWLKEGSGDFAPAIAGLNELSRMLDHGTASSTDRQQYQQIFRDLLNRKPKEDVQAESDPFADLIDELL